MLIREPKLSRISDFRLSQCRPMHRRAVFALGAASRADAFACHVQLSTGIYGMLMGKLRSSP